MDNSSPKVDTSQYRRAFADYNKKLELAHFEYRAGLVPELKLERIDEEYGDLFTLDSVKSLRLAEAGVSDQLETEKSGTRKLLGAACISYLNLQTKNLTNEIARRESASQIVWNGEKLPFFSVPRELANESSRERRTDLYKRWLDCVIENDDLREARFKAMHQSTLDLGFTSYLDLYTNAVGTDFHRLAAKANAFLERTETPYRNALSRIVARDLPEVGRDDLQHADFFRFQRFSSLDPFFSVRDLMPTYESAMRGFGIHVGRQQNIAIDATSRPSKHPRASCLRVNPPDDIRLLVAPIGGAYDYMTLFHEAGHAQHFGWSSRELVSRHPEFMFSPDLATTESFAFVLNNLFHDDRWLREYRPGISEEQSLSIARDLALLTMHSIRRYCAKLLYDIMLHDSMDVSSEQLATAYSTLQNEATGFRRGPELYLWDIDDGFYSAAYLRAWTFEAGLREYLRTRYGYRWWASRKAGDELIDLWSTSSRHSVDELSSLLGMGDMDFDLLAETYIASISEE